MPFFVKDVKKHGRSTTVKTQFLQRVIFFASDGYTFRNPGSSVDIPPPEEALTPETRTKLKLQGLLNWAIGIQRNSAKPIFKLFDRLTLSKLLPGQDG